MAPPVAPPAQVSGARDGRASPATAPPLAAAARVAAAAASGGAVAGAYGGLRGVRAAEEDAPPWAGDDAGACPGQGAALLASGQPWHFGDLGLTLRAPIGWRVEGAGVEGWRLRALPPSAPLTLTLAVRRGGASALRDAERAGLLAGWQRRGYLVERASSPRAPWAGGVALRLRSPSDQPVRALYLPHPALDDAALLLTLEGPVGAQAAALDAPTRAILQGLSSARPSVERTSTGLRHLPSGVTLRAPAPGPSEPGPSEPVGLAPLLLPTAPPAAGVGARMAWLDLGAACPLWAQLDVQVLAGEPPPATPAALDRLARGVVGAALAAWPDATPEPLLPGRLGALPALRFSLQLSAVAPFGPPLPLPPARAPQPWSLLGVVVARPDAPPVLLRAWVLDGSPVEAERRLTQWLNAVSFEAVD